MTYEREIGESSLRISAIKLQPEDPFQWASGFFMPIYNDNRLRLFNPELRRMTTAGFVEMLQAEQHQPDVIAGTSTAGISPGTSLADKLNLPFIYIRDKPKEHGLKNQIEGIDADKDLGAKKVLVIEDLISTGGSSARAVQAVRDANGKVEYCFSIFDYGLDKAVRVFAGEDPIKTDGPKLDPACKVRSLLTYDVLIQVAEATGYVTKEQAALLKEWREDPFGWGEKHGFPPVKK